MNDRSSRRAAVALRQADVERALRNIFWASYHPTMAALPHLRTRGRGRIVNVTSIGGKVTLPPIATYAAGKFAAMGLSEMLAVELAQDGIVVSAVTPPPLRHGAQLATPFGGRREQEFAWFAWGLSSRLTAIDVRRAVVDAAEHGDLDRALPAPPPGPAAWLRGADVQAGSDEPALRALACTHAAPDRPLGA